MDLKQELKAMEIKDDNIEELIQKELSKPNYLIESSPSDEKEAYTAIYFSSNGIFGNKKIDLFKEKIIKKNIFEFYGTRINKATKHIFLRDITLNLYTGGINTELNSVEKVLEFLKEETKGTKIITLGSSAGGYAATLFGILLNAEYIFNFSGQFLLSTYYNYAKYNNIIDLVRNSNIPIFYMIPSKCMPDVEQFNLVKDFENIYGLPVKSSTHGIPVIKDTLKSIINSDLPTLKKMYNYKNQEITETSFIIKHFGFLRLLSKIVKKNAGIFNNYIKPKQN